MLPHKTETVTIHNKEIIIFALFFAILISNVFAQGLTSITFKDSLTYSAPVAVQNGLDIKGESKDMTCNYSACEYYYQITNTSGSQQTVNIFNYLDGELKEEVQTKELKRVTSELRDVCLKYEQKPDANAKLITTCTQWGLEQYNYPTPQTTITPITKITKQETLLYKNAGYVSNTTSTVTINNLETKQFLIRIKPKASKGELIIKAVSTIDNRITGSLDPWYDLPEGYSEYVLEDFEDSDYNVSPTWVIESTNYVNSAVAYEGSVGFESTGNGFAYFKPDTNTGLGHLLGARDSNYSFWIRYSYSGMTYVIMVFAQEDVDGWPTNNYFGCGLSKANGLWLLTNKNGASANNYSAYTSSTGTWYNVICDVNWTTGKASAYLYSTTGTLLGSVMNKDINNTSNVQRIKYRTDGTYFKYLDYLTVVAQSQTANTYSIDFNVYRLGTTTNLTNFNMDCNFGATYDGNFNSPKNHLMGARTYDCNFSRTGYDSNLNFFVNADANKSYRIDLNDSTAPVVGQTLTNGFGIVGTNISGSGNIQATASDAGSDINATACYYTINNGSSWLAADKNATHCYKNGLSVSSGNYYQFNMRAIDNANNVGAGTATLNYYGGSVISLGVRDENTGADLSDVSVLLNGVTKEIDVNGTIDLNSLSATTASYVMTFTKTGYATRYYQFDGNSNMPSWDLNFLMLQTTQGANLTFTLYSTDDTTLLPSTYFHLIKPDRNNWISGRLKTNVSSEVTLFISSTDHNYYERIADVNTYYPVAVSVLYPINEETNVQIVENWKLDITSNVFVSYTNLSATKIIYLLPNTDSAYTLKIQDMNSNYFSRTYTKQYPGNPATDSLQPYLVSSTTGLLTTINTIDALTLIPISSINIKIYKNGVYVEEVTTDSKGQAISLLVLNASYTFDIYQNSSFLRTDNITATSNTIYVKIPVSSGLDRNFTYYSINTAFNPFRSKLITSDTNLKQTITLNNSGTSAVTISSILIWAANEDINGISGNDRNLYLHLFNSPSSPFVTGITLNNILKTLDGNKYDTNGSLNVYVLVTVSDGNTFLYFYKYSFPGTKSLKEGLSIDVKGFFGCSTSDPLIPCAGLLLVSLFLALIFTIGLAIEVGATNMEAMGIMFLAFMGLFTFFEWVPYLLYGIMIITFVVIEVAMGGNKV